MGRVKIRLEISAGMRSSIYKNVAWKIVSYEAASLELVGVQDGGGNAAVVRNA